MSIGPRFLEDLAQRVDERSLEMSISLLCSGWWVVGTLSPSYWCDAWMDEVTSRAQFEDGRFKLPTRVLPHLTDAAKARMQEEWRGRKGKPFDAGEDANEGRWLFLRNASAWNNERGELTQYPYFVVKVRDVSAWTIGLVLPEPRLPERRTDP